MTSQHSITEFLNNTNANFRLFDMGCRVSKLSVDEFLAVEQGRKPYPKPYLKHAWLAFFLWQPENKAQSIVWFLRLPLDERGQLVLAARDDVYQRLLKCTQTSAATETNTSIEDAMKDNPFSFTPEQEKMAMFHAQAAVATQQHASLYYEHVQQYLSGQHSVDDWVNLGYQGFADMVVRQERGNNIELLTRGIETLPEPALIALCTCLESIEPNYRIFQALQQRFSTAMAEPDTNPTLIAALLRAGSQAHDKQGRQEMLRQALERFGDQPELLAAIATRCQEDLSDEGLLHNFMEKLASAPSGQQGFSRIVAELMYKPSLRQTVMAVMRRTDRSDTLSEAIGQMFGGRF